MMAKGVPGILGQIAWNIRARRPLAKETMMTDTKLNEKIARLMGWTEGMDWFSPGGARVGNLPDLIAPHRLAELMHLAEKIVGLNWDCGPRGASYIFKTLAADPCEVRLWTGSTLSLAIARAIVAHAEGKVGQRPERSHMPTTGEHVTVTCPAPPEPQP